VTEGGGGQKNHGKCGRRLWTAPYAKRSVPVISALVEKLPKECLLN